MVPRGCGPRGHRFKSYRGYHKMCQIGTPEFQECRSAFTGRFYYLNRKHVLEGVKHRALGDFSSMTAWIGT